MSQHNVTNIKAVSVKCFELFNEHGVSLGLFKVKDQWRSLFELQSVSNDNQTIVIHKPDEMGGLLKEIFGSTFGGQRVEVQPVLASPSLIVKFSETEAKGK